MLGDIGLPDTGLLDRASGNQLVIDNPGNKSLFQNRQNLSVSIVTPLGCNAFSALCALHWLAVIIIVQIAFGIGCAFDWEMWKERHKLKIGFFVAAGTHFLVKPLLIFAWIKLLDPQYALVVALLVIISLPGGQLAYLLTLMIEGDKGFSASLAFLFTLLALLFLPLNLYVYASHWLLAKHVVEDVIAYPSIIFTFLLMMVPMGIGVLVAKLRPRVAQAMNKIISISLLLTLLTFTILGLIEEKNELFQLKPDRIWISYTMTPFVGLITGHLVASLLQRDGITGRTLAVDTMTQNCPLAAALLKLVFPSQFIGIFYLMPLLYLLIQFVESIFFIAMIKYKLKREAEEKENAFFALGGVPVGRIRRISLHTIDKIRRSLTWSRSSEISSGSVDIQEDEDSQEVFTLSMRRNNLIKMAIAEEEEMSASSLSRKENEEKMTTLNRLSSQTEEEKEAQFEDVDISKSE